MEHVILELLLIFGHVCSIDWCMKSCDWLGQKHVKCIFKLRTSNDLCPSIQSVITPKERRDILLYHNTLREDVAVGARTWRIGSSLTTGWAFTPSAAGDMRQMVWDYELEENALIYASQCDVKSHKPYDCASTEDLPLVHMNKYDYTLRSLDMELVLKEWVLESRKPISLFYKEKYIVRYYFPGPWDDFFATIFGQTYKLGCAKVICDCHQSKPLYNVGSVACLYGPTANFSTSGYPIYRISSKACTACPPGTSCNKQSLWPHLCATEGDPRIAMEIPNRNGNFASLGSVHLLLFLLAALLAAW